MNKRIENEDGFSVIEGTLVLVIIALIGVIGWLTYGRYHNMTTKTATTVSTSQNNAFKVPQLGIKIENVPAGIADLTDYQFASNTDVDPNNTTTTSVRSTSVQFSTLSLTKADSSCSAQNGSSIGALSRIDGRYVNHQPEDDVLFVKQFNGFYVTYSHPMAACSSNATAEALHQSQTSTMSKLLTDPNNLAAL